MDRFKIKNFTDLIAWQEGHSLILKIYHVTEKFPGQERFGLSSQMRRAAVSITSNLAEGFGRRSKAEKKHFYNISSASLAELQNQIYLGRDLGFIELTEYGNLNASALKAYKLINGLISATESAKF